MQQKATSYDVWMNKCGRRARIIKLAGKTAIRSTAMMISPLVSKVNPSHLADFGVLVDAHWWKGPSLLLEQFFHRGIAMPAFAKGCGS